LSLSIETDVDGTDKLCRRWRLPIFDRLNARLLLVDVRFRGQPYAHQQTTLHWPTTHGTSADVVKKAQLVGFEIARFQTDIAGR
jgi:hypothetical protein